MTTDSPNEHLTREVTPAEALAAASGHTYHDAVLILRQLSSIGWGVGRHPSINRCLACGSPCDPPYRLCPSCAGNTAET